jgi:hypothetical protein
MAKYTKNLILGLGSRVLKAAYLFNACGLSRGDCGFRLWEVADCCSGAAADFSGHL